MADSDHAPSFDPRARRTTLRLLLLIGTVSLVGQFLLSAGPDFDLRMAVRLVLALSGPIAAAVAISELRR